MDRGQIAWTRHRKLITLNVMFCYNFFIAKSTTVVIISPFREKFKELLHQRVVQLHGEHPEQACWAKAGLVCSCVFRKSNSSFQSWF